MKRNFRYLTVFALLLVVLALFSVSVSAQDDCFNLPADDCAIITSATANMSTFTSFDGAYSVEITASGMELLAMLEPSIPGSVDVMADGTFIFVESDIPTFELSLNASANLGMESEELAFALVAVDGFGYLVKTLGGETEVVGTKMEQEDLADFDLDMSDLGDLNLSLLTDELTSMGLDLSSYMSFDRLDDKEMMGQAMYPFQLSLDLGGYLQSDEFGMMLNMLLGSDQSMAGMITPILETIESQLAVTQYVGADDNYIHKTTISFGFTVDLGVLMGMAPGSGDLTEIYLLLELEMGHINEALTVTAPEGATMLSPEEFEEYMDEILSPLEDLGF